MTARIFIWILILLIVPFGYAQAVVQENAEEKVMPVETTISAQAKNEPATTEDTKPETTNTSKKVESETPTPTENTTEATNNIIEQDTETLIKQLEKNISSIPALLEIVKKNQTDQTIGQAMDFILSLDFKNSDVVSHLLEFVSTYLTNHENIIYQKFLHANESCFESLRYILKVGNTADKKIAALLLGKRGEIEIDTFVELLKSISSEDQKIAKEQLILNDSLVGLISRLIELVESNPQKTLHQNVYEIFEAISKTNIPALFFSLKSAGKVARSIVIKAIATQGNASIPPMIGVLRLNPDEELKKAFYEVSKCLGTSVLMEVLSLTNDNNPSIRETAKIAVQNTGNEGLQFLLNILETSENPKEKLLAMNAFSTFGEDAKIGLDIIKKYLVVQNALQYPAVLAVGHMGDASKLVIPELMEAFRSEDWMVRSEAAKAMAHAGKAALPALNLLIDSLKFNEYGEPEEFYGDVRSVICKCIGNMGERAHIAVDHLIRLLRDMDENVVRAAAEALGKIGPRARKAIDPLIQVFSLYGTKEREVAAHALAQMGSAVIQKAIRILRYSDDIAAKEGAAMICKYLGEQALPAIDALIMVLKFDIDDVKRQAALALGEIGPISVNSMRALIDACRDESPFVREAVAESLGKMGSRVVPWITSEIRRHVDEPTKITLIQALGHLGQTARETLPVLLDELPYNHPAIQKEIIKTIAKIGGNDQSILMPLVNILKISRDNELHVLTREAILGLGESCIPAILELFKERAQLTRQSAVFILDKMGDAALPHLLKILNEGTDEYLMEQLIPILGKQENVLEDLLKLLNHPSPVIHRVLVDTLSQLGMPLIPRLIHIIQNSNNADELHAVHMILVKIGVPCLPQVIVALKKEDNPQARQVFLRIIGDFGSSASMAISVLVQLLSNVPKDERLSVAKCLGKIGPASLPYLVKLLYATDKEIQSIAIVAMGETNSAEAVSYLLKSIEDPNMLSIAIEAIIKLRHLGVPILIRSLEDPNPYIRFACVVTLSYAKDKEVVEALKQRYTKEDHPMVRYMMEGIIK